MAAAGGLWAWSWHPGQENEAPRATGVGSSPSWVSTIAWTSGVAGGTGTPPCAPRCRRSPQEVAVAARKQCDCNHTPQRKIVNLLLLGGKKIVQLQESFPNRGQISEPKYLLKKKRGGGDNTLQFIKLKKKKKETSLCAILQKREQKRNPGLSAPELSRGRGGERGPAAPCPGPLPPPPQPEPSPLCR